MTQEHNIVEERTPVVGSLPLRLSFSPDAIREHYADEDGKIEGLTEEQLCQVGMTALTDDLVYSAFHEALERAITLERERADVVRRNPVETQHTPGPWYVDESEDGIAMVRSLGEFAIAGVYADANGIGDDFAAQEANARLIAATPDLYSALHVALDALQACAHHDGDDPFWNDGGSGREACNIVRSAIDKAVGR